LLWGTNIYSRTTVLLAVAVLAFAANSLLCRFALGQKLIDPASFTAVRVITGAVMLTLVALPRRLAVGRKTGDWRSIIALFLYMAFFSFAYLSLSAGTGALILFGSVQSTMFAAALRRGEHFPWLARAGFTLAVLGLVLLLSPGVTAPDPAAAVFMALAGIAWGSYSLIGRSAADPLEATANNFIYSVPLVIALSMVFIGDFHASGKGLALAATSGIIASGLGYVAWYAALKGLTAIGAATVQLSVPIIASCGGVLLLSEQITARLVLASLMTLGGVAIVLAQRAVRT
jgi:drug/metabolite transporter (DMT)-like permease